MLTSVRAGVHGLAAREFDLLVVGGGITGAGVLRDAALRGLRAALVEQGDFASGTSSRSSRLIHGGLRYLEYHHWGLVFEALRERAILRRIAPHLVHPLAFIAPVHRGDRVPWWKLALGLGLYGLLAAGGNVPRPRMFGKAGLLALEPNLRVRGLRGGGLYYDAQCDDARLVIATLRSALARGAAAANYARVTGLFREGGRVAGAEVTDLLDGTTARVRARVVVNAAGPWVDDLLRMEEPATPTRLRLTSGVHVVVPRSRLGHTRGIIFTSPVDGRVVFVLPWGEFSYIGTTETEFRGSPDQVRASADEVRYLLRSANALFPNAHLADDDLVATWAGVRPLLAGDPAKPAAAVSREHQVQKGPGGLVTVAGGKLTTYRRMAAEAVDLAIDAMGQDRGRYPAAPTDVEPLPGGEAATWEPFVQTGRDLGLTEATMNHLVRNYGTETAALCNLMRSQRDLMDPIHPDHPAVAAEVIHVARRELAIRVDDVLDRRLRLTTETRDHGLAAAGSVARLLGRELGWDEDRIRSEEERFRSLGRGSAPPGAEG